MMSEVGEHPLPALTFEAQQTPANPLPLPAARPVPNVEVREKILGLEQAMKGYLAETGDCAPDLRLTHHFAPGAYGREMILPKGSLVVGKIHKHAHLNFVMKGRVTVGTEEGVRTIVAPAVFVSQPGTKRVVYAHDETVWVTVHVTTSTNLEEIEEQVIAKTFVEYDALHGIDTQAMLAVMAHEEETL